MFTAVCVHFGRVNAEHKFREVTILGRVSRHFHFHLVPSTRGRLSTELQSVHAHKEVPCRRRMSWSAMDRAGRQAEDFPKVSGEGIERVNNTAL